MSAILPFRWNTSCIRTLAIINCTDSSNCKYVRLCNWTRNLLPRILISICVLQTLKHNISRDNQDVAQVHIVHMPCIHSSQTSKTVIQTSLGMTKDWTGKVAIYRYLYLSWVECSNHKISKGCEHVLAVKKQVSSSILMTYSYLWFFYNNLF